MIGCGGSGSSAGSDSQIDDDNLGNTHKNSTIYGGGPLYFGGQRVMDELRYSGFTTINFWTIHVESNGDLIYNDQLIVSNGEYVGRQEWPEEIASLKEEPTSINRVQFGVASYGVPDFERIQEIIENEGTGTDSILYKNFSALKAAIPSIDAIDFDDESTYHAESATIFGVMLADIGYKISLVPYTAQWFWEELYNNINDERPGTVDRVQIQAYAGGAGNQPSSWNGSFGDSKVSIGLWSLHGDNCNQGDTPDDVEDSMRGWQEDISGGFIWLYDDVKKCGGSSLVAAYASAINKALNINEPSLSKAEQPIPENDQVSIDTSVTLKWTEGFNAEEHEVYLSLDAEITSDELIASQSQTTLNVEDLASATKYFWRVDEKSQGFTVKGDVWTFTTKRDGFRAFDRTSSEPTIISARGENSPNEVAVMAFDDSEQTKWLDFAANTWLQVQFSNNKQFNITEYTITSANDSPERDPKEWNLMASNDGENWEVLDVRENQYFSERFEKRRFTFNSDEQYKYYLFEIKNHGGGITQIAEIELIEYVEE